MAKKVTINDIARESGVSKGTVYRAIHDRGRINDETKKLVLDTIDKLDYKANTVARGLALHNQFNILVIMPQKPYLFWDVIRKGTEKAANELAEYGVTLTKHYHIDGISNGKTVMEVISENQINAISLCLVSFEDSGNVLNYAHENNLPLIVFNENSSLTNKLAFYGPNDLQAGQMAGEMICKFCPDARQKVAVIVPTNENTNQSYNRLKGFEAYMSGHGRENSYEVYRCSTGESGLLTKQIFKSNRDIAGIYYTSYTSLIASKDCLESSEGRYMIIGHEYCEELGKLLEKYKITALLVQERITQGYYPIMMLFNYLITGDKPEKENYFSNITIVLDSNTSYLNHNEYGCGYE